MNQTTPVDILSLHGFVNSILGQKFKVLLAFLLVFSAIIFYTVNRSRDYESSAKLFVRKGRETVTVDPLASASGQVISVSDTQDREINSIVAILRNRDLMETVVDKVGIDTILEYQDPDADPKPESTLKKAISSNLGSMKDYLVENGWLENISDRENAIITLRDSMTIQATDGSAVIKVSIKAESPKLAQILNTEVIDAYYDFHVRANQASGSYEFLNEQTEDMEFQLEVFSETLADLKKENNVASLGVKKEVMERQLLAIDNLLIQARANGAGSDSKIKEFKEQMEENVTRLNEQIKIKLLAEEANRVSYTAQITELESQRNRLLNEIKDLNSKEYEMVELERQVSILDANYRRNKEDLEQVRINREMESRSLSNVNVVQFPSFVDYPTGPSNKIMYAMGFLIALCFSFAVGLLAELYLPHQSRRANTAQVREIRQQRRAARHNPAS